MLNRYFGGSSETTCHASIRAASLPFYSERLSIFGETRIMKIVYQTSDIVLENEEKCQAIIDELPEELIPMVNPLIDMYMDMQTKHLTQFYERMKYQIMWHLRSLEHEIGEEGGMLKIDQNGRIQTIEFSPELTYKIGELLQSFGR
jgi:hypothetical protein